ncbi:MAG: LEPR-XLL domain-containing protein, partial [Phycisphaera sp.]|nr:LEPR-XLL domain-containing protein [Phycisphaera sp.]
MRSQRLGVTLWERLVNQATGRRRKRSHKATRRNRRDMPVLLDTLEPRVLMSGTPVGGATLSYDASNETDTVWNSSPAVGGYNINFGSNATLDNVETQYFEGKAYTFTGAGGGTVTSLEDLSGNPSDASATWEFWIRPTSDADIDTIFETGGAGDGFSLVYDGATNEVTATLDNGSVQVQVSGGSALLNDTEFHQVVVTYGKNFSGSTDRVTLYIDNTVVDSDTTATGLNDWSGSDDGAIAAINNAIAEATPTSTNYEGQISVFRFYEFEFTAANVTTNYIATMKQPPPAANESPVSGATLDYDAMCETDLVWVSDPDPSGDYQLDFTGGGVTLDAINTPRISGQAYTFDGTGGDAIDSLDGLSGDPSDNDASWELWFRPDAGADTDRLFETGGSGDGFSIVYDGSTNNVIATMDNGSRQVQLSGGSGLITTSDFHQIVVTYNRNFSGSTDRLRLYIDNTLVDSSATVTNLDDWAGPDNAAVAILGGSTAESTPSATNFEGQIAVFRFYERELNATEVGINFNATMNQPVDAIDDSASTDEDTMIAIDVLGNDTPAGDVLAIVDYDASGVTRGTLTPVYENRTIAEFGTITTLTDATMTINLTHQFVNPVVFAQPISNNETAPGSVAMVSNVTNSTFNIAIAESQAEDGVHAAETVSWFVIEAGVWRLSDGTILEVGTLDTGGGAIQKSTAGFITQNYLYDFSAAPAVMSQAQTRNGFGSDAYFKTRENNIGANSFDVAIEEEEVVGDTTHVDETIGYLAIEKGNGTWDGVAFEANTTADSVTQANFTLNFSNTYSAAPHFLGSIAKYDGADPAALRYASISTTSAVIYVDEDNNDGELVHISETVSYLAVGAPDGTLLTGDALVSFTYTPDDDALDPGDSAMYSFTYTAVDKFSGTDTATVNITVDGVNDAPTAFDDSFATLENTTLNGNVLADNGAGADSDPDASDSLTVFEVNGGVVALGVPTTLASGATLTVNSDGSFAYDGPDSLAAGQILNDSFTYTITDTHGAMDSATVSIAVTGENDGPVAVDDTLSVTEDDGATMLDFLANDSDVDSPFFLQSIDTSGVTQGLLSLATSTIGEVGTIAALNDNSQTINFSRTYINPVVFAQPISLNGGDASYATITSVTTTGFSIEIEEASKLDQTHTDEQVQWIVLEAGRWLLEDGTTLEVGTRDTSSTVNGGSGSFDTVTFSAPFDAAPVVVAQPQTRNTVGSDDFFKTRLSGTVTTSSFGVALEEDQSGGGSLGNATHVVETIGYFAIDAGTGDLNGATVPFEAVTTAVVVDEIADTINFMNTYSSPPIFVGNLATFFGVDPAELRRTALTTTSVTLVAEEDMSSDMEVMHADEAVSYIAIGAPNGTLISAYDATSVKLTFDPNGEFEYLSLGESADQVVTYTLVDDLGATSTGTATITVTGVNDGATLTNVSLTPAINEDETVTLDGEITDVDLNDAHTLVIDWGDGTVEQFDLASDGMDVTPFTYMHQYLDDDPTATSADDYDVTVQLYEIGHYEAAVLADSPDAYFRFSETTGVANAVDETGNYTGTYHGDAATMTGQDVDGPLPTDFSGFEFDNSATHFDGNGDWVSTDLSLNALSQFTIETWIRPSTTPQAARAGDAGQNDVVEFGFTDDATLLLYTSASTSLIIDAATAGVIDDQWTHLVAVGTGTEVQVYVNGVLKGSKAHSALGAGGYGSSADLFNIGGGGILDPTDNYFNGDIDDVAFYTTALSGPEILAHYNAAAPVASDSVTLTTTVSNVPAQLQNVVVAPTEIFENSSVTLTGEVYDPGTLDSQVVTIDWGDGNVDTINLAADGSTTKPFNMMHTYRDDNPSGTMSDDYDVKVTVVDDDFEEDIISVNFANSDLGSAIGTFNVTGVTGAAPAGNWNNVISTTVSSTLSTGAATNLIDSEGDVTSAAIGWTTHNTFSIPTSPDDGGIGSLFRAYLDTGNSNSDGVSIDVANLPAAFAGGYSVIVYFDGNATGRFGEYVVSDDLGNSYTLIGNDNTTAPGVFIQDLGTSSDSGNYLVFDGLSGTTLNMITADAVTPSDGNGFRAPVSAIQIVPDPAQDTVNLTVTVNNAPPIVTRDDATVTAFEGDMVHNTGGFNDIGPDDDVTITVYDASNNPIGTVMQDSGNAGAWSWWYSTTNGPDETQTLTVRAVDDDGGTMEVTFDLIVNNVPPDLTIDGTPIIVNEGDTAMNTGTYTDPGPG